MKPNVPRVGSLAASVAGGHPAFASCLVRSNRLQLPSSSASTSTLMFKYSYNMYGV